MLQQGAQEGYLQLKYLDESGFSRWASVSYSWSRLGTQKRQEQTRLRGQRVSILGLWEPQRELSYGLTVGSITSTTYIQFMDKQAQQSQRLLQRRGMFTVIVQDNASIHTSKAVLQQIDKWQAQGLYFFQLPKYCSEMNRIETEWLQIKAHEIRGQMFDDIYALAQGVITAVGTRAETAGYTVRRFNFQTGCFIRSPIYST